MNINKSQSTDLKTGPSSFLLVFVENTETQTQMNTDGHSKNKLVQQVPG